MRRVTLIGVLVGAVAFGDTSPEVRLDDTRVTGPAPGEQFQSVGAPFDGGVFLAWTDSRTSGAWPDVSVAVIAPATNFKAIAAATGPGAQRTPTVACGTSTCLVVWAQGLRILGRRFDFGGNALDATPVNVSPVAADYSNSPSVAFDGANYLVLWTSGRPRARVISESGALGPEWEPFSGRCEWPHLAAGRLGVLAGYLNEEGLSVRFVERDGGFGPARVASDAGSYYAGVSLAAGPDGFVTGHVTDRAEMLATLLDESGGVTGPPVLVATANPPFALAAVDGGYFTAWAQYSDLNGRLVPTMGAPPPAARLDTREGHEVRDVALVGGPRPHLLYSSGPFSTRLKLRVRGLSNLMTLPELPPLSAPNAQTQPAVAWNGSSFLAVWADERLDGGSDVRARRLDELGQPVGPAFDVVSGAGEQVFPVVSWNGAAWVVVWRETAQTSASVQAALVTPGGSVGAPVTLGQNVSARWERPGLAHGPEGTVVLWSTWQMRGYALVSGQLLDGGLSSLHDVTPGTGGQAEPSVVATPSGFLVASTSFDSLAIELRQLDPTGAVRAGPVVKLGGGMGYPHAPSIVGDGTQYLVAWLAKSPKPWVVFGQRVDAAGQPIDPAPLHLLGAERDGEEGDDVPQVAFDGERFLVAFSVLTPDGGGDLVTVSVGLDGGVGTLATVSGTAVDETEGALASASPGRVLAAYRTYDEVLETPRVAARVLTGVQVGDRCLAPNECLSGSCIGFVCCEADGGCSKPDAGASVTEDGGVDAGGGDDGGVSPGGRGPYRVGCDCSSTGPGPLAIALLLLGARAARRARR